MVRHTPFSRRSRSIQRVCACPHTRWLQSRAPYGSDGRAAEKLPRVTWQVQTQEGEEGGDQARGGVPAPMLLRAT